MDKLLIRASQLGNIMTNAQNGADLSKGAQTYIRALAKQAVYNFTPEFDTKEMLKGEICENDSIALYNNVFFTNYHKNDEQRKNKWISGTCDIFTGDKIIDIKTSWSKKTFPATQDEGKSSLYEWQLRAYMMLWDVDNAELAYCLVDTPEELLGNYEDFDLHTVSDIPAAMRITTLQFERDSTLEKKIITKCTAAQSFYTEQIELILNQHKF